MKETIERGIHPPPDGWVEDEFYIVDVVIDSISPIVRAILFTGKLNANGQPAEKSLLFNAEFGKIYSAGVVHYMKPIAMLSLEYPFISNLIYPEDSEIATASAAAYEEGTQKNEDFNPEKVEELAKGIKAAQEEQIAQEEGSKTDWKENLL